LTTIRTRPAEELVRSTECAASAGASVTIRGEIETVSGDEPVFFSRLCFEPGQTVALSLAALGPLATKDRLLRIVSRSPQVREGRPRFLYRLAPVERPRAKTQHDV
jgi:hypothetical protein